MENKKDVKYTEKDLVSFGEYVLSKKRNKLLKALRKKANDFKPLSHKIAKRLVSHADLENWKELNKVDSPDVIHWMVAMVKR